MDHSGKVLLMAFFGSYIGRCMTSQKWPVIDESERRKAFILQSTLDLTLGFHD